MFNSTVYSTYWHWLSLFSINKGFDKETFPRIASLLRLTFPIWVLLLLPKIQLFISPFNIPPLVQ